MYYYNSISHIFEIIKKIYITNEITSKTIYWHIFPVCNVVQHVQWQLTGIIHSNYTVIPGQITPSNNFTLSTRASMVPVCICDSLKDLPAEEDKLDRLLLGKEIISNISSTINGGTPKMSYLYLTEALVLQRKANVERKWP